MVPLRLFLLRVLRAVVRCHKFVTFEPLLKSYTFIFAFAPFPSFHSLISLLSWTLFPVTFHHSAVFLVLSLFSS